MIQVEVRRVLLSLTCGGFAGRVATVEEYRPPYRPGGPASYLVRLDHPVLLRDNGDLVAISLITVFDFEIVSWW